MGIAHEHPKMLTVIDSNMLRNPVLEGFLRRDRANRAVICDYVSMEMYKGDPVVAAPKSMMILAKYPEQVVVLKSTVNSVRNPGWKQGLSDRLIDHNQTKEFATYANLVSEQPLRDSVRQQLTQMGIIAASHFERVLHDAEGLSSVFSNIVSLFDKKKLEEFRIDAAPYSKETVVAFLDLVYKLTAVTFENHPSKPKSPSEGDEVNTFTFRYVLCATLLWKRWIKGGRQNSIAPKHLVNDLADANIAAYATFFDGILSNDNRLNSLYSEARSILSLLGAPE